MVVHHSGEERLLNALNIKRKCKTEYTNSRSCRVFPAVIGEPKCHWLPAESEKVHLLLDVTVLSQYVSLLFLKHAGFGYLLVGAEDETMVSLAVLPALTVQSFSRLLNLLLFLRVCRSVHACRDNIQ